MDAILVSRLENVANRMESILLKYDSSSTVPSLANTGPSDPAAISNLDEELFEKIDLLCKLSNEIGGDVGTLGNMIREMFSVHRSFVWLASGRQRPDAAGFQNLSKHLSDKISAFALFKDQKRTSKFSDHISAVEGAAGALGWVAVEKTPVPYISDSIEMAMFYINRILKNYKDSDSKHVDWANALKDLWKGLQTYVKKHHTTGLVWNSKPGAAPPAKETAGHGCAPPPPPPPPPALLSFPPSVSVARSSDAQEQILKDLNSSDPTSRLKKVTADMQTHKNPGLRADNRDFVAVKANTVAPKQKASIFWDGKVWRVDYIVGNQDAVVEVTDKKESIYIYKCANAVVKVKGKANAITLDGCLETAVVFDGLVAQCEIINSQKVQIQTLGELPTVSIQKTDGCQVFLSRAALNAHIVASKSSEMNVSAQLNDGDDHYTELAIPEQFVTRIEGNKLVTSVSEII